MANDIVERLDKSIGGDVIEASFLLDDAKREISRLREALSSARINLDLEGEEHTNTKEALSSETAAREKAERERDEARETLRSNSVWDFPRDIQNLTVKLDTAEATIADLIRQIEVLKGSVDANSKA